MKKVVVVGGSGFLGSHVADRLSDEGYKVTILDIAKSKWIKKNQKFILCDVLNKDLLNKSLKNNDYVFNFAALSDIDQVIDKPSETIDINLKGHINIMNSCILNKIKRYIFASTLYVYGDEGGFYRCSKQSAEIYLEEYQRRFNLKTTTLRFGSLYGPRSNKDNGIRKIIENAINNKILKYDGHPESIRDYIHVYDASEACIEILNKKYINEKITISGSQTIKVIDLLETLREILNLKKNSIKFSNKKIEGHYIRTPYKYKQKISKKYIPSLHIDMGQGLMELIDDLRNE